jgi:hypothetical protein
MRGSRSRRSSPRPSGRGPAVRLDEADRRRKAARRQHRRRRSARPHAPATTIGQLPPGESTTPELDLARCGRPENSMHDLCRRAAQVGGQSFMSEHAAPGQPSWNDGVDYAQFFSRGDAAARRPRARSIKPRAGLEADLAKLKAARASHRSQSREWWSAPGARSSVNRRCQSFDSHQWRSGVPEPVAGYDAAGSAATRFPDRVYSVLGNTTPCQKRGIDQTIMQRSTRTGQHQPTGRTSSVQC